MSRKASFTKRTLLHLEFRISFSECRTKKRKHPCGCFPFLVDLRRFVCIFAEGKNRGVAAVQPAASNSPPDCCIWNFESPSVNAVPKKKAPWRVLSFFGGPEEIRTPDPYNANVMRSQLRYRPVVSRGMGLL